MRRRAAGLLLALVLAVPLAAGCTAASDDDGEIGVAAPAPPAHPDALPVLVDTDLGGDDLAALAFLLRHPGVEVRAVTVAATGLTRCAAGVRVLAGLLDALGEPPLPVACGRAEPGASGRPFPAAWRAQAETGSGIRPVEAAPGTRTAVDLMAEHASRTADLVLVALGPLTNVADLARDRPADYARLAAVHAMAGSVGGPLVDGVAEWNAAADPEALATVLAAPVPLTVVPEDAVPEGTPDVLSGPVTAAVAGAVRYERWWDLATAAALVAPEAVRAETGAWSPDAGEPGRLRRDGDGPVRVVRDLERAALEAAYAVALAG